MDNLIKQDVTVTRVIKRQFEDPAVTLQNDATYQEFLNTLATDAEKEDAKADYIEKLRKTHEAQKTQTVRRIVKHSKCLPFERVLSLEQDRYVKIMEIPKGVATNRSLKENLFMILVCTMTRLPIVLVGKPGSSKTLSMLILRDNLNASTKNKKLDELGFEDVYL
eukprot:UN32459